MQRALIIITRRRDAVLVSRGQTSFFSAGRYRLQYKRPAFLGAYTASDNAQR